MTIIEDYQQFQYTQICARITLERNPSDHEENEYYLDIACENLYQQNCYVGTQRLEEIHISRLKSSDNGQHFCAPQWKVQIIIAEVKTELEVYQLLQDLCKVFSFSCAVTYQGFEYSGLYGFSFQPINVVRRYAKADRIFGDSDMNCYGKIRCLAKDIVKKNIFQLPQAQSVVSPIVEKLKESFLIALKSKDAISRYLLLYYLFEIMYESSEYQAIKQEYDSRTNCKKDRNEKRSEILHQYLQREFGITTYRSFGGETLLTPEILCKIIQTRNDLTHRADTSAISQVMYRHMIPILQKIFDKCDIK